MSYTILRNGSPQAVHYGTDDVSVPALVPAKVEKPIHLPLIFAFTERGDCDDAHMVLGDAMFEMYGRNIISYDTAYTTFMTPYIELFNTLGNAMMIQRIVPADAKRAGQRVYLEIYASKVPTYKRDEFGALVLDADGNAINLGDQDGYTIVWHTGPIPENKPIRQGSIYQGTTIGSDGNPSTIYPIIDLPASFIGGKGNDICYKLSCPNAASTTAVDTDVIDAVGSRLYTLQFLERADVFSSPTVTKTTGGAAAVTFSFKPGAYYKPMKQKLDYSKVVQPSYRNMNPDPGYCPKLGPLEQFYVYDQNLLTVLELLAAKLGDDYIANPYLVDPFTGLDVDGNPYNGVVVDTGVLGGEVFTDAHVHYLTGGSNGTMSNAVYDQLVGEQMSAFGDGVVNYRNMLKYPCSFFYDGGFTTATKEKIARFIGVRPDTYVIGSTHVYSHGANDLATENSMKVACASFLRAYPDSSRYGTPAFRAAVVGHSYVLRNSEYDERVPVNYSLARFLARFAGAQDSKFKPEYRFDRGEFATISEGYDINLTYKAPEQYVDDWDAGLINVRSYDMYQYFFPALKSVYTEDRSILAGLLSGVIKGDLTRILESVWAATTGDQSSTDSEILADIKSKILAEIAARNNYADVVSIEVNPYFTAEDKANGYSVTVDVHMSGQVMRTVDKFTIVAHRRS